MIPNNRPCSIGIKQTYSGVQVLLVLQDFSDFGLIVFEHDEGEAADPSSDRTQLKARVDIPTKCHSNRY